MTRNEALAAQRFSPRDVPDQTGRTVLVTGSNHGLGLRTATVLAAAGARIVLACRNQEKAAAALKQVRAAGPAQPLLVPLDLSDLTSVRAAAKRVASEIDALDVLVNNAGVMAIPKARTADGFEMQLGVNHLGHFALTDALLPLLLKAPAARVVTVASIAHRYGRIDFADVNYERRRYLRNLAYGQSKLANLLFSAELARRAAAAGRPLISVAVHPGVAATNLFDSMVPNLPGVLPVLHTALRVVGNSEADGALSQIYAASMPDVRNDDYLGPTRLFGLRGSVARSPRTPLAASRRTADRLWQLSVDLTGAQFAGLGAPASTTKPAKPAANYYQAGRRSTA
jgi:NAD(P)-dependent dehydrogenase (short-subunit alcohol dehydrogenase family)